MSIQVGGELQYRSLCAGERGTVAMMEGQVSMNLEEHQRLDELDRYVMIREVFGRRVRVRETYLKACKLLPHRK